MIERLLDWSIANRLFIVLAAVALSAAGLWAVRTTRILRFRSCSFVSAT